MVPDPQILEPADKIPRRMSPSGITTTELGKEPYVEIAQLRRSSRNKNQLSSHETWGGEDCKSTPPELPKSDPPKKRARRIRLEDCTEEYLNSPVTEQDRREWKGWCDIESDPVSTTCLLCFLNLLNAPVYPYNKSHIMSP